MTCEVVNALWLAGCLPEAVRFRRATTRVREEQERVLRRLLHDNADTEFGRRFRFSDLRSVADYQSRVPLASYDDLAPWIDRACTGIPNLLTRDAIRLFEPTSGSAGHTKLIPMTAALQREFQRAIRPWIADLFLGSPELLSGQAYWSVSPAIAERRQTPGGIAIGFDDDAAYLGGWQRRLVDAVRVVPATVSAEAGPDAFQYHTLLALVRASRLRLISVWNPTFLTVLVDRLPAYADALEQDLRADAERVHALCAALAARTIEDRHHRLWPDLRLISCWTDANAAAPAARLARLFPHARIQAKGLIATEAFISLPLTGCDGAALAVRSHFLEFAPIDTSGSIADCAPLRADEIEEGGRYEVIVTTGGGLYRYRLGDVVEVVGRLRGCALIRFLGRHRYVSDWFGEKLSESHAAEALHSAFTRLSITPSFAMLACDTRLASPAYVLYIETGESDERLHVAAAAIDADLRRNFHYDYARGLGQLGPVRVFRADAAGQAYVCAAIRAGQRAGDVKPLALERRDGWSEAFSGRFITTA